MSVVEKHDEPDEPIYKDESGDLYLRRRLSHDAEHLRSISDTADSDVPLTVDVNYLDRHDPSPGSTSTLFAWIAKTCTGRTCSC